MADNTNLEPDEFVTRLVRDPNAPPNALLLVGYIGNSSEEDHIRLYFDAELSNYVEVPQSAVLHTQRREAEQSPLGGSYIWIDREAELVHGKVGTKRPKAKFFEGPLTRTYMPTTPAGGITPGPATQQLTAYTPASWIDGCPSVMVVCDTPVPVASNLTNCPSWVDGCPSAMVACDFDWRMTRYINPEWQASPGNWQRGPQLQQEMQAIPNMQNLQGYNVYATAAQAFTPRNASWVDGCPSAMVACDFDWRMTRYINPAWQTGNLQNVVMPQPDPRQMNQQFQPGMQAMPQMYNMQGYGGYGTIAQIANNPSWVDGCASQMSPCELNQRMTRYINPAWQASPGNWQMNPQFQRGGGAGQPWTPFPQG